MNEVAVAWPDDETTAGLIASRLAAEGIAARVDRGLWGSYQVPLARGQLVVRVPERDAARARELVGDASARRRVGDRRHDDPLAGIAAIVAVGLGIALLVWIVTSLAR